MEIKFIILLIIILALVFLLFNEINTLKILFDKKNIDGDKSIGHYINDVKQTIKLESDNYKAYTTEMLSQIRRMNNIERQTIILSDQFIETGNDQQNIMYLSDVNKPIEPEYMSTPSEKFIVKDEQNNALNSVKQLSNKQLSASSVHSSSTKDTKQDEGGSIITCDINKLKNIARYSKQQLVDIANNNNIPEIDKLTKQGLYNILKTKQLKL